MHHCNTTATAHTRLVAPGARQEAMVDHLSEGACYTEFHRTKRHGENTAVRRSKRLKSLSHANQAGSEVDTRLAAAAAVEPKAAPVEPACETTKTVTTARGRKKERVELASAKRDPPPMMTRRRASLLAMSTQSRAAEEPALVQNDESESVQQPLSQASIQQTFSQALIQQPSPQVALQDLPFQEPPPPASFQNPPKVSFRNPPKVSFQNPPKVSFRNPPKVTVTRLSRSQGSVVPRPTESIPPSPRVSISPPKVTFAHPPSVAPRVSRRVARTQTLAVVEEDFDLSDLCLQFETQLVVRKRRRRRRRSVETAN